MDTPTFEAFAKIPRLSRDCIVTEKIDGTNGQIYITRSEADSYDVFVGSRNRWLSEKEDNHGFYKWVQLNKEQIVAELGEGKHYGEWWGAGINKRYPGAPKTFSLFQSTRWTKEKEEGRLIVCDVVPIIAECSFTTSNIDFIISQLFLTGSKAWPGAIPEGIVIYHTAANCMFKKTLKGDEKHKGVSK